MKHPKLCIVGNSRTQQKNPIMQRYSRFFITFIVDSESGKVLDLDASVMLKATNEFIKELFIGCSLANTDQELLEHIRCTYMASSQKAIQMAYLDAVRNYNIWLSENSHRIKQLDI